MTYYKQNSQTSLTCILCSHYCKLKSNQIGICGVNKNVQNTIKCLVYGHIDALHVDKVEKKPLYHFLPDTKSLSLGTVGCNFKCDFCQNHKLSQNKNFNQNFTSPENIVQMALNNDCKSISFTYNEPTIFYPFAKDISILAKEHNLKSIFVSNGFQSKEVINDMPNYIDALNIDLKSYNEKYYKQTLKGKLKNVLNNIVSLVSLGLHVEITTLIVPTCNDDKNEINDIINFIKNNLHVNIPWHISAFYPNYKKNDLLPTSKQKLIDIYNRAKDKGLNYVYIGNVGMENLTICPNCNEILIKRQHFSVSKNILKSNFCPKCKTYIQGVFSE